MLRFVSSRLPKPSLAVLCLAALLAAGCVANDVPSGPAAPSRAFDLSFDCGDGESLNLTGDGATVVASDSQDTRVWLQASPPDQRSRYDADGHALVLNEREALWMKAGAAPMTCRR